MAPKTYSRIVLVERPKTTITDSTFKTERDLPVSSLSVGDDGVMVEVLLLSCDPAQRGWLNDARSYLPPVGIGETMRAGGIGRVLSVGKNVKHAKVGDLVVCTPGWTTVSVVPSKDAKVIKVPAGAQVSDYLGVMGMPGMTAYFGLLDVGALKEGEAVAVSGAAGAVGALVCQIAKLKGCKVMATAGDDEKCRWLREEVGVDLAINYKSADFTKQFRSFGFIDVCFDNTGSQFLDLALSRLQRNARIVICGAISGYNGESLPTFKHYMALISQRARMEGFVVFDYAKRYAEAERDIGRWLGEGKIKRRETRMHGLDSCVPALKGLFEGKNTGKMIVDLAPESKL